MGRKNRWIADVAKAILRSDMGKVVATSIVSVAAAIGLMNARPNIEHASFLDGDVTIRKWDSSTGELKGEIKAKNLIHEVGKAEALMILGGISTNTASSTTARIGVGDSYDAVSGTDTDLQGTIANKTWVGMDSGYPLKNAIIGNTLTWRATFDTTKANWRWNEIALNSTGAGIGAWSRLINSSNPSAGWGTKTNSEFWTVDYSWHLP